MDDITLSKKELKSLVWSAFLEAEYQNEQWSDEDTCDLIVRNLVKSQIKTPDEIKYQEITVVEGQEPQNFTDNVNLLLDVGWVILDFNCGFIDDASYDYCSVYQAILGLPKTK